MRRLLIGMVSVAAILLLFAPGVFAAETVKDYVCGMGVTLGDSTPRATAQGATFPPRDRARRSQHLAGLRRASGAFIVNLPGDERAEVTDARADALCVCPLDLEEQ